MLLETNVTTVQRVNPLLGREVTDQGTTPTEVGSQRGRVSTLFSKNVGIFIFRRSIQNGNTINNVVNNSFKGS